MKKIFKKLLITTALVTPIAISTPLLLTSCSTDIQMSVETPPIFGDITPTNLIQSISDEANKKYFVFDITNNDFAEKLENQTFTKIWDLTPGPKFDTQVNAIADIINTPITDQNNKIKFTRNSTESNAKESIYDSNVLGIKEQFDAVKALFSNSRMTNIIELKTNDSSTAPLAYGVSFKTDDFLRWDKINELKNNIESKLQISVGEGDNISDKPLTTASEISLILTPKNNYVWPGLKTSDPIAIDLRFEQNEKAALFNNGFVSAEPKFDSTAGAFVFNATLDNKVFGADNLSKVTGTNDIKKWLESENGTVGESASGGTSSQSVTPTNVPKKIKTIFTNLSAIKNIVNNAEQSTVFDASKLITSYIKDADSATTGGQKQNFNNTTNNHVNGGENIILKNVSTNKKTSDSSNKEFVISLVFGLADTARQEWFGITDSANKNKDIKFDLTVNLEQATKPAE